MGTSKKVPAKVVCKGCGEVTPVVKMWGVLLCPKCNIILEGGKFSMDKVG